MKYIGLNYDLDDDEPLNEYFTENGFESKLFIKNSGSTLIFIVIYFYSWVILFILKMVVVSTKKIENIYSKLKTLLIWNGSLAFLNAQFSNLFMCSLINL